MNYSIKDIEKLIEENKYKDFNQKRDISLDKFNYLFKSNKKLISLIFLSVFILINFHTIYMRIFNPVFLGKFTLLISDPLNKVGKIYNPLDPDNLENTALRNTRSDIPTLIKFLKSTYIIKPIAEKFNISDEKLQKKLSIEPIITNEKANNPEYAGILEVNFYSKSPKKDKFLLNALSQHFINSAKQFKQQRLKDGLNFLALQEPALQDKVNNLQNKISLFRQRNLILEPTEEGELLKKNENNYLIKIRNLDENHNNLKAIKKEILNGKFFITGFNKNIVPDDKKNALSTTGLNLTTKYQPLLDEFNKIESELSLLRSTYKPNSKIIKSYEQKSNSIRPILKKYQLEAVEAALLFNRTERNTLEKQRKEINEKFKKQPLLIKEYETLLGRLNVLENNFNSLINAKEEFQLQLAKDSVSWTIIEPPLFSKNPIYPSIQKRFISSIFLGLILSFIFAFYKESGLNYFKNKDEIINRFRSFNFLGLLNNVENFDEILKVGLFKLYSLKETEPQNQILFESIKLLKENIRNIFVKLKNIIKNDNKIFLITSSQNGEGKYLLSVLLSITISEIEGKVLFIDGDLRNKEKNYLLNIDINKGLSEYLNSENNDFNEYKKSFEKYPNFDFIHSGLQINDPIKLFSSNKFQDLIRKLRESDEYKYVFINTFPIDGVSDALVLSKYVDKVIFLISVMNISKDLVYKSIKSLIEISGEQPLLIANNIKKKKNELEIKKKILKIISSITSRLKLNF